MPKSNGRPVDRLSAAQKRERLERIVGTYREYRQRHNPIGEIHTRRLADRRDYRETLIHRLATAHGDRKARLEQRLQETEQQIRESSRPVAA